MYEVELYLVCGDLPELKAGVYHFAPADFGLRLLRAGDFRRVLVEATDAHPAVAAAPLTIICTGTYWRNAWKCQARTYRHFGWDNGTILANLLAMCTATQLPATVVMGFNDDPVNRLLDLDTDHEVAISLTTVGSTAIFDLTSAPPLPPLHLETLPLSDHEVDYPAMREMHAASSLATAGEVRAWREQVTPGDAVEPREPAIALPSAPEEEISRDAIERVILRRGSTRQFAREAIGFRAACHHPGPIHPRISRRLPPPFGSATEPYLRAGQRRGWLAAGAYYFHRDRRQLELLKQGDFRRQAGYLGLEQDLPADAAANVFFLADLQAILARYGNRGYRAAQLEAGILGGKLYLAAYAQYLGASGLTFYETMSSTSCRRMPRARARSFWSVWETA